MNPAPISLDVTVRTYVIRVELDINNMFKRRIKGASLLEYGLLVGLIAAGAIVSVRATGVEVREVFLQAEQQAASVADASEVDRTDGSQGGGSTQPDPTPDDGGNIPETDPEQPGFVCGDSLDVQGETYGTVQVGTQCWMSESLRVGTTNSMCYNNDQTNCDVYGRM